jgi:two-component system CheB/CheR fusion protein
MVDELTLKGLVEALAEEPGLDFRGYKHTSLERRIQRRMHQLGIESFSGYLEFIRKNPGEPLDLLNTVLINVTRFFRDPHAWDALAGEVLPVMFRGKQPGTTFRVWCAGCATGEEAYSVAILLLELLGNRTREFEIKIYASDNDENALSVARRGEYQPEALRGVRPEIKARYFTGDPVLRVTREVRRLVIFGRSNILTDAPISHVDLLVCRNVLIYFDPAAQSQIMVRFRYALNEGGVLFLGKSESQLKRNSDFHPINARWRIFQRRYKSDGPEWPNKETAMAAEADDKRQELERLKVFYDTILDTLEPGVLVLDSSDTVITENDKVLKLWDLSGRLARLRIQESELWQRCPELKQHLEESRQSAPHTVRFECNASSSTVVTMTIRPIISQSGSGQVGTLIYMENVTSRVTLQNTIEELETTAEELQSTNEELETTNEELQSTNEELETTNEELQSTNEELETTNEELQSLNEELETTNEELSSRTQELDELNTRYSEMMERMPWPVFLVNNDTLIYMFNSAAQKLFGFAPPSEQGIRLEELPLDSGTRQAMLRRLRQVVQTGRESQMRDAHIVTNRFNGAADLRFTPLSSSGSTNGVIVMFEVGRHMKALSTGNNRKPASRNAKKAKPNSGALAKKKSSRKK